jgi:hypothetical protein
MTVQDAEHIVMLISIVGGLFCARVWSVAAVAVIAGLLFPTLLTLFMSPEWKRLGFERYFEMQAGNFIALAGYFMVICAIFAFGAHLLRHAIGLVARLAQRWHRPSDQEKVQNEATEGAHALIQPTAQEST